MKLSDIESKQLLPRFASDISWLMNAFDGVIKTICERVKSIDAPLTLESVQACTDEELEALYDQYGVAQYYPNLSRQTRDLMLFEMVKIYRYLGTPKAIEILCKYIFDNNPIVVKVLDNLAFNDNGELIDESLLDVFDVNVESQSAFLDEYANARILANIIRFSRNSQFLRYIYYDFPGYFDLPISPINGNVVSSYYENDAICEPVELTHYTFVVADATTGQIVSGFSNELVYGEIEGIVLQSPKLVYGIDISVPTAQFWFTANGRNETENTVLQQNSTVTVYDENGDTITDEDTIGMYDTASVLAYMQANGDMVSKQDDVLIDDNGDLGLQVDSGPISAWSVFTERVFTLSFENTQLPGITITLPADETGYKGTSITLPTMSGEYESGGKTWTPSAWDIGAFGSSYTLNADTVAHLLFEEVQQYEEITLYFSSSSNFAMQGQITSGFTGNVDSAYIYQLYTDAEHTIPWNGYDYSNDYEIGYYSSGNWVKRPSVQEMPDSTSAGNSIISWILLDTGYAWGVSNIDTASRTLTFSNGSITVRIRKKDQQYYAFYASNRYGNESVTSGSRKGLVGGMDVATSVPWGSNDNTLPARELVRVLGSAGNQVPSSGLSFATVVNLYQLSNNSGATINIRAVVFTLSTPTNYCYPNNTNTNASINSSANYQMFDADGNNIPYESAANYRVIGMFKANGDATTNTWGNLNSMQLYGNASNNLCLKYTGSGTLTFYKVWYTKIFPQEIDIDVNFGDPVTIPAGYHVESVKCERLYLKASKVTYPTTASPVGFEFLGEAAYCDDTSTSLVGKGVLPCLAIFAFTSSNKTGYHMSYRSTLTPSAEVSYIFASNINSGGYFVRGEVQYSQATADNAVAAGLRAWPALFRLYDVNDVLVQYHFTIQSSLWQFQNGVFSWVGNAELPGDLAYWYNGQGVRIHCVKN